MLTFGEFHIEDVVEPLALNAVSSVEEGVADGAIGDVSVELAAEVVLVDEIGDGLSTEHPIARIQVGLVDSVIGKSIFLAVDIQEGFDLFDDLFLLRYISPKLFESGVRGYSVRNVFECGQLYPGCVELQMQIL